jgi:hypothetical protein
VKSNPSGNGLGKNLLKKRPAQPRSKTRTSLQCNEKQVGSISFFDSVFLT